MKFISRVLPFGLFLPALAFAASPSVSYFTDFLTQIQSFISAAIPVIFALAFLVFLWGIFKAFILGGSDEEKQSEGKKLMLYAIIGFVVLVSVWGIVNLVISIFGVSASDTIRIPKNPLPS